MKQWESVNDYSCRVQGLLSKARHVIEEEYTGTYGHVKESLIMMKPMIDCALDVFISGLPDDISIFLDTRNRLVVELVAPEFCNPKASFLVDPGSDF